MVIPAVRVSNHDPAVVLDLHSLVLEAQRAHQFHAADLEPDQVIRVVDHAHLIRLRVAYAHHRIMIFNHRLSSCLAIEPTGALPAAANRALKSTPMRATESANQNSHLETKKTKVMNQCKDQRSMN